MMEVSQAVPPVVDFKDKMKVNGVVTPNKLIEKKSSEMDKLTKKPEVLAEIKDVSTENGDVNLDDILAADIDDRDLLNTDVNGGEDADDIDILAEEFLNEIGYEEDSKIGDNTVLNEEQIKEALKKTEEGAAEEQKTDNLESNDEKVDETLPNENLDKEKNKETEAQVETKTDEDEEMTDLEKVASPQRISESIEHLEEPAKKLSDGKIDLVVSSQQTISKIVENVDEPSRNISVEKNDQLESLPAETNDKTDSEAEGRLEKRLGSRDSNSENITFNEEHPKIDDSEKVEDAKSEKCPEFEPILVESKVEDSNDEQAPKALKSSDCDIINLDSPMAVEDKDEKTKSKSSASTQDKNVDSSTLIEDSEFTANKRRRKSGESRTSRENSVSREEKKNKDKTEDTQVTPEPKRRKSSLKDDLKDDDIVLLDEKLEIEETILADRAPFGEKDGKAEDKIETIPGEKESNENDSDDDVVFLEDEKFEIADSKEITSKSIDKEENKEKEFNKSKDLRKEVAKPQEEKPPASTDAQEKDNDSDDDVVLLVDDGEDESEVKNASEKEENKGSTTITTEVTKGKDSLDEKAKEKTVTADAVQTKKSETIIDDDDDVVLLEVDDEKVSEKIEPKKVEEDADKAKNDTKEVKTKEDSPDEEEVFSVDTSITPKEKEKVDKEDEDDDEVVFMDEKKSTQKEQTKDQKEKAPSAATTRSSSRKSSKDVDEPEQSKTNAISSDNTDNAQDKFPEKTEEDSANADGDNNLLEEGKPPEICSNDEVSDLENSNEPLSKRIKVDDETSQSSLTMETEGVKSEGVDRKSLKRSISSDSLSQESKKLKAESSEIVKEKKESDDLLIPRPPPIKPVDINLDFLKRFKKSISKMTKADLEELVLQKIVEAIVNKSEFSEMRDLIEKQEKVIATHRTKIAEITKQFRDLEMVHNRVVKDIETKNQQFIMPVKITRAVGLQVLIPKRTEQNGTVSKTPSDRPAPTTPTTTLPSPTVSNTIEIAKRKCAQKVTPLRPDTAQSPMNRSFPQSIAQNGQTSSPATNTPQLSSASSTPHAKPLQKILPRGTPTTPVIPQQNANTTQTAPAQYIIQQPSFNPVTNQSAPTVRKSTNSLRSAAQPTVQRPPAPPQSSPDRPRVPPMILKKSGTNGQVLTVATPTNVTVTPVAAPANATPPNKSFIDLTDEDDARPQTNTLPALVAIPAAAQPTTRVTYVVNKPNSAPQRVTVTQNSTNMTRLPAVRTRAPYAIAPKPAPVPTPAPAPQSVATQSGPRMPTANSAIRRSHPAPLPKSPPALSNPAWKAAPPRPAIRINNIDSGIVISWTMDDMTDQHAEVTSYQIYAYQETNAPPQVEAWRHVGDVKAMLLPMAVTLTQFQEGQRYYFAVRAVDMHSRCGPFSIPKTWS